MPRSVSSTRRWLAVTFAIAAFVSFSAPPPLAQDAARRLVTAGAGAATASSGAGEAEPPPSNVPAVEPRKALPPLPERILGLSSRRGDGGRDVRPDSPRGAVEAYLAACREGDYAKAAAFLDLDETDAADGPRLAQRLKLVLDRTLWIDVETLSDNPEGDTEDGLQPDVDRLGTIESVRGKFDINVWRRPAADGAATWAFTPGTLRRLDVLYEEFGSGPFVERLPAWMRGERFLDLEAWQWIGLATLLAIAWILSFAVNAVAFRFVRFLTRRTETTLDDRINEAVSRPLQGILALLLFLAGFNFLALPVRAGSLLLRVAGILWIGLVVWGLMRLVDALTGSLSDRLSREGRRSGLSTVTLTRRVIKVVVLGLGAIAILQNQGFNVSGVVAGLGIGGIAVALAAQKTLENVFGGVVLAVDQPIRVGDSCRFGDQVGTIEDIGLRSTRVRTLDRTVVTVPNAELSTVQIENFAMRDRIRLLTTIGLRYETSPDQLRFLLAEIRKLLLAHPKLDGAEQRVRFVGFGATSLDVEILAYALTTEFGEFAAIREDLYLRIMDVVAAAGTGFAFPSQTLYVRRDDGIDAEAGKRAEERVRLWRASGELPFPDPDPAKAAEEHGTLDWPPKGSVAHRSPPPSGVSED